MARLYSIYFQKNKSGSPVLDTYTEWSIVCKDFPFMPYGESKDLPAREWADEDGEDTFFPEEIKLKAYDIDVEFAYKGEMGTANSKIEAFLDTYTKIGRQGVYYKSIDPDLFVRKSDEGDVITFKITFRVTDPRTSITLTAQ